MKKLLSILVLFLLSSCGSSSIWNAGDLAKWVRKEALDKGCEADSIVLDEWYVAEGGKNNWKGRCKNGNSGEAMEFSINVDKVWTPSSEKCFKFSI